MKRFLLLLAAFVGLLITGCNKNNQDDSLILGSWKGYSRSHIILKNGEPVSPADYLNDLIKAGIMEEPEDEEEWAEAIESLQEHIYDEYLMEGDEDIILRFEKDGKLTSIYEDEEPISQNLAYVKGELFMEEARQLVKEYLPERYFVVDAVTLCHQRLTDKGRIFAVET